MLVSFTTRSLSCVSDVDHGTVRRKKVLGVSADERNFYFNF